jgi:hypothetical protein
VRWAASPRWLIAVPRLAPIVPNITVASRTAPTTPERGNSRQRPARISTVPAIIRKDLPRPIIANGSAMKPMPVSFA